MVGKAGQSLIRAAVAALVVAGLGLAAGASESDRPADVRRVQRATEIFRVALRGPGSRIPETVMKTGECVAIIPGYKTLAFGFGGGYGKGVAMCRNGAGTGMATPGGVPGVPGWSAPIFIAIGGASIGSQIGVESADLIIVFQSRTGLVNMLNDKLRLGASAAAAAGPVGRRVEAATDATMQAEAVGYARSRGLFIGVNLNGAIVQPDESGNRAMYPHQYWQDVLDGHLATPASARTLVGELNASPYTNPAVLARNPGAAAEPASAAVPGPGTLPPLPFSIGIAYDHVDSTTGLGGWDLRGGWRPLRRTLPDLSLIAEGGHNSGTQSLLATSVDSTEWTYLFGPEFDQPSRIFDPFAHILFGGAHLTQTMSASTASPSTSAGFHSFAWEVGAGLRLNITRQFSIRVIQLDLLHTSFNNNAVYDGRYSIGASFNF